MESSRATLILVLLSVVLVTKSEVYTALAHMKSLLSLERDLLSELEKYITEHEEIPDKFKHFVDEIKDHQSYIKGDEETFLGHPMNAFLLVRRFRGMWAKLEEHLQQHDDESDLAEILAYNVNGTVSKQDVFGCLTAIMRIQEVYKIDARSIAEGRLSNITRTPSLDPVMCYEIGYAFYQTENHEEARDWMLESLKRLEDPEYGYKGELKKEVILQFLAWSEYMTDRLVSALNRTILILKLDKDNDFANRNIEFLSNEVQTALEKGGKIERQDEFFKKPKEEKEEFMKIYERLCRGESKKPESETSKLYCYYERKRHPLFLIRPLKIEILNMDPYIVMLRDVMYDSEIEYIKTRAGPLLNRATVTNPDTGELEFADYRVSKSGWLEEDLHDDPQGTLKRVNRRISLMTGLDARRTSAEALQIVNYGIAGHYEPHFDHATCGVKRKDIIPRHGPSSSKKAWRRKWHEKQQQRKANKQCENYSAIMRLGMGNRIATVLFYMTDVESGGSTVFVDAETIARPRKGDAAFWYNLMRSGEGDPLTRHAGCPVVVGSKWVCNKWIHEQGQEFIRPCTLSIDE